MADLDDFVTRARTENEGHHCRHTESMTKLSATVGESFSNISSHYKDTFSRVETLRNDMETDVKQLQGDLEPLDDNLCQPLGRLRQDISKTDLREYEPTGETPEKIKYQYPTQLPRTAPHDALLAGMRDSPILQSPSKPTATPGKRTPAPQVFNDFNDTERARSPSRPTSSDSGQMARNQLSSSLREMNANMTTSALLFDATASTMSSLPSMDENTVPIARKSRIPSKGNQGHPTKKLRLDGVENMPPNELTQSTQRRRSARLQ